MKRQAPKVVRTAAEWRAECASLKSRGSLGFVPTMGALHKGHESLFRRSAAENAATAASVYVNPAQFNDKKDLEAYPRRLEDDLELMAEAGVDAVFAPGDGELYPDGYLYRVGESELSRLYCGAFRPGHFEGVLTVVLKLLSLTGADRAYFGEKDWQQYLLVRGMAEAFFLQTEIVPCPTVREASGLALSSRNERLSAKGRATAPMLRRVLDAAPSAAEAAELLEGAGFRVEYVEDLDAATGWGPRRIAAAWLEGVRLIDNLPLSLSHGAEA